MLAILNKSIAIPILILCQKSIAIAISILNFKSIAIAILILLAIPHVRYDMHVRCNGNVFNKPNKLVIQH